MVTIMTSRRQEQANLIDDLITRKFCAFPKAEAETLVSFFNKYVTNSNKPMKLDRTKFRDILHNTFGMTDDMLMDRVFRCFDQDNDNVVSCKEWLIGLSVFLKGTMEQKTKYCFAAYDLNGDGFISREEMFQMLKNTLVKQPSEEDPDEGVKDMVELVLKKMDIDHDGKVSYKDFSTSIADESLYLEAFGPCLPSEKVKLAFFQTIAEEKNLPSCHK